MEHPETGSAVQQGDPEVSTLPEGEGPHLLCRQLCLSQQKERDRQEIPTQRQVSDETLVVFYNFLAPLCNSNQYLPVTTRDHPAPYINHPAFQDIHSSILDIEL